ncbi:Gr22e [Drosophila busckii]|uniref:Gustatory receptor n=1 Tax=Drosophila busckii TaxID=30019 RepID=A0A0M4E643_DROBS|nr:Gr22e [Drosophila busckii]
MFLMEWNIPHELLTLKLAVGVLSIVFLQLSVLLVTMHFHLSVAFIYRAVWIINRELLELVYQLNARQAIELTRVRQLHALYSRLLQLNTRLLAIYDYPMVLFTFTILAVNIIAVYYYIVFTISLKQEITFVLLAGFLQALAINFLDFWSCISICELAERASRGTSMILKLFSTITLLDVSLNRCLEDFAMFCCHRRLRFLHCGLYYVNNAMGFRMLILGTLSILCMQLGYMLFTIHFHLSVALIYRAVWIINRELLELAHQLNSRQTIEFTRVRQLHALYSRILQLNTRLTGIYDLPMALFTFMILTANIIAVYYFIVFTISLKQEITVMLLLGFVLTLVVNILDFWSCISICELAERASRGTSMILKLFSTITLLDVRLNHCLDDFAMFCSLRRLRFLYCGLYYVNNAMGFRMLVSCVLYLLWLVQYDFRNL